MGVIYCWTEWAMSSQCTDNQTFPSQMNKMSDSIQGTSEQVGDKKNRKWHFEKPTFLFTHHSVKKDIRNRSQLLWCTHTGEWKVGDYKRLTWMQSKREQSPTEYIWNNT